MSESPIERPRTVLIADNDPDSPSELAAWLRKKGYAVIAVSSGSEALQRAEIESPDLIFIDIHLARTDPFELLFRLKASDRTQSIPVFITSGDPDDEQKDLCSTFGALEYIEKPYEIDEVASLVARAIG